MMKLVRLTEDYPLHDFDCGDRDLNEFLLDDAKLFLAKRIATTFVIEDEGRIVAYFCLLNDKVSRTEITNSRWKKIRDSFPEGKRFRSYPTIKIGRFAVSQDYRGQHIGTVVMDIIKGMLDEQIQMSSFRFLTVDAYLSAIDFYKKNGFIELNQKDEDEHTRLMYFDMLSLAE